MDPLISIVIPTYNRADDLRRALLSVKAQTYHNWEVLVVDNHSTDETDEVVKNFNDAKIHVHKIHNNGLISASRNKGITCAKGEYIAFLDSDDWWKPTKLAVSIKYLQAGADIVYHDLFVVKKVQQKVFKKKVLTRNLFAPVLIDLLSNGNSLNNSSVIVRKTVFDKGRLLPEEPELNSICDFHGWLKLAEQTDKFVRVPETLGYYWLGGGNTTSAQRTLLSIEKLEVVYQKFFETFDSKKFYWTNYTKARAHYQLHQYAEARSYLNTLLKQIIPFELRLKVLWMLFFSKGK